MTTKLDELGKSNGRARARAAARSMADPKRGRVSVVAWLLGGVAVVCAALVSSALAAQQPAEPPARQPAARTANPEPRSGAPAESSPEQPSAGTKRKLDPYSAYEAGEYDRALEGFVDQRVARPDDAQLQLNVGSAYYKLEDFQAAEQEYRRASETEKERLRAEALYNLGNAAYRQGRLEEAVTLYQDSLALASDDQDAKYNLEFVKREIERRRQQAQQQQQQPQQQQQQQQQQQEQQQPQGGGEGQDSDRDGLPDSTERQAENPTDPKNPDTDGDARRDGEEDRNRNGRVDEGETDPNQPDAPPEGNGANDQQGEGGEQQQTPQPAEGEGSMSPEEAARYLQGLDEKRPAGDRRKGRPARRPPGGKPW